MLKIRINLCDDYLFRILLHKIATNTQFTYHNFVLEWLFSEKGDMLIKVFFF